MTGLFSLFLGYERRAKAVQFGCVNRFVGGNANWYASRGANRYAYFSGPCPAREKINLNRSVALTCFSLVANFCQQLGLMVTPYLQPKRISL